MVDISDVMVNREVPRKFKDALLDLIDNNEDVYFSSFLSILVPTDSNDDVNGSQHVSDGGSDFTYRDATFEDVQNATSIGHYEYFSNFGDVYTGHYYNGDGNYFSAIVIDPPSYAVSETF